MQPQKKAFLNESLLAPPCVPGFPAQLFDVSTRCHSLLFLFVGLKNKYPLVICYIANWKMAIEIVDLPSYKIVTFHSYVSLPEVKYR
jgi:hypothetical protein